MLILYDQNLLKLCNVTNCVCSGGIFYFGTQILNGLYNIASSKATNKKVANSLERVVRGLFGGWF